MLNEIFSCHVNNTPSSLADNAMCFAAAMHGVNSGNLHAYEVEVLATWPPSGCKMPHTLPLVWGAVTIL